MSADEQQLLIATQRLRNLKLTIEPRRRLEAITGLQHILDDVVKALEKILGDKIANRLLAADQLDEVAALQALNGCFGLNLRGTAIEQINVGNMVAIPDLARAVMLLKRARSVIGHLETLKRWKSGSTTTINLEYAGAHTRRWSCKTRFLGVAFHGLPKNDKEVAKYVRSSVRMPDGYCAVRGDLAQAEFRKAGQLCTCEEVQAIFDPRKGGALLADPYKTQWHRAFGQVVTKKSPQRMIQKTSTIAQTYRVGEVTSIENIALAIADPANHLTVEQIQEIAQGMGLLEEKMTRSQHFQKLLNRVGTDPAIVALGAHLFETFKSRHYRFNVVAKWLVNCVNVIAKTIDIDEANTTLEKMRNSFYAPDPNTVRIRAARSPSLSLRPSALVAIGDWSESLTWREPAYRKIPGYGEQERLSIIGQDGAPRAFTESLALQNLVQAGTRNDIARGMIELERRGYPWIPTIHDEIQLIVPRRPDAVLHARKDLLEVFGPESVMGFGWSVVMDPAEITVTESMWEDAGDVDPATGDRWGRIERDEPGCLDGLP